MFGKRIKVLRDKIFPNGDIISAKWFSRVSHWWVPRDSRLSGQEWVWRKYDVMNFVNLVFKRKTQVYDPR